VTKQHDQIIFFALGALVLGAFLVWGVAHVFHRNPTGLFYFGDLWAAGAPLPQDAIVRKGPGYDGEFYYRVARDPLLPLQRLVLGSTRPAVGIDTPAYRYRRIAYPLAARLAGLGSVDGLVWSFPLVAVLAAGLGVFSTSQLFVEFGRSRWWGAAYVVLPGIAFSASRNLCDGLALALVSAALLALARRRTGIALALLAIAHLAHETTVLVSGGCLIHSFVRTRRVRDAAPFLLPIGLVVLWSAIVVAAFSPGIASLLAPSGSEGLGMPLVGIAHKLHWLVDPEHAASAYAYLPKRGRFWKQEALLAPPILLALGVLLRAAWERRATTWVAGLLVSLFVLTLGDAIWNDAACYARVTALALLLALRTFAETPDPLGYAFVASLPFGFVAALGWCLDSWRGWFLT